MKKLFKYAMSFVMASAMVAGVSSCSSNDEPSNGTGQLSKGDQYLKTVLASYVDNTINPTYKALAESSNKLYEKIKEMREASKTNSVTQAQVNEACQLWKDARASYEKSEAFLLGAAADYNIDPHIDTWPLDINALITVFQGRDNKKVLSRIDGDEGPAIANGDLGQNVLGFHAVEFIIFRDGKPRDVAQLQRNGRDTWNKDGNDLTDVTGEEELIFATAVAGDLRNSCYRLEVCWNENAPEDHVKVIENLEWSTTAPSSSLKYGQNMKMAQELGSTYASVKGAVSAVLVGDKGCVGISDEVGGTKINKPFSGEDEAYIESPYSYNSLTDFFDNIQSISNVWNGGIENNRSTISFAAYFKNYNPTLGNEVQAAIDDAQAKIKAIPTPFVLTFNAPANKQVIQAAIDACKNLSAKLTEANNFIGKNNQ